MHGARVVRSLAAALTVASGAAISAPATAAAPEAAEAARPTGSRTMGRALFSGAARARNGGPPCGACHAIGGEGAAFAGSLGPDLSKSFDGLPADAVDGLLQDLPFPTMAPLYGGHPLTPAERADLAAFLTTAERPAPPDGRSVAGWAAALALACLAFMSFAARRRKGSTRAGLTARPTVAGGGSR